MKYCRFEYNAGGDVVKEIEFEEVDGKHNFIQTPLGVFRKQHLL